jgi:hypothetical protein
MLALALGVLLRVGYELAVAVGGVSWADAGLQGAALGLAAAGLYSGGKRLGARASSPASGARRPETPGGQWGGRWSG